MKDTKKGFRDGEVVRANVTPGLALIIRDAVAAAGADPVGIDDILARVRPARLNKSALRLIREHDEEAALAEERAGL